MKPGDILHQLHISKIFIWCTEDVKKSLLADEWYAGSFYDMGRWVVVDENHCQQIVNEAVGPEREPDRYVYTAYLKEDDFDNGAVLVYTEKDSAEYNCSRRGPLNSYKRCFGTDVHPDAEKYTYCLHYGNCKPI